MIDSRTSDAVTTITLNRPDKLNAFAGTMREDLLAALRDAGGRVVVITGAGRAFCAGGDVENMARLQKAGDVAAFRKLLDAGGNIVVQIAEMPQPVIASINGVAAGAGCNLALACDYRIAAEEATLGETFVRIGIHPDWGGTWTLPRLVGTSRAMEIMMTGRMVGAAEALAIGMVDRVVSDLPAETEKLSRAIAAAPPAVIADIKRALAASRTNDLRTQLALETEHQLRAFATDEAGALMAAFLDKRKTKIE